MKVRSYAAALLLLALLVIGAVGCDDVTPTLAGTPTPSASPTPLPDAFTAEITAAPEPTDALGKPLTGENHYRQYLSFGDMRVYEYDDGTFLDGVCVNAFPAPLDGRIDIVYYTSEGKTCGIGTLHNAVGTTRLETGANNIYAEINTDINVCDMEFVLEIVTPYAPAEAAEEG